MDETELYDVGYAVTLASASAEKQAAESQVSYGLEGRLYLSQSGWLLMQVPNALGRGAFDALNEPGVELPTRDTDDPDAAFNAHVTVMSPDEIERIGGPSKISERGHAIPYTLGPVKSVEPAGWDGVSRAWYITVQSPELARIRKSYGLEPKRNGYDFHVTFAIRRKNVLRNNAVSKAAQLGIRTDWSQRLQRLAMRRHPGDPATAMRALLAETEKVALSLDELHAAAADVDPEPTEAQKKNGNYKKGHVTWKGLRLTIETAKGQTRRGTDAAGKPWSITMKDHYGYIKNTESDADGDHIDIFLCEDHLDSEIVFVVDQYVDGKFDEHKCILGCISEDEARKVYNRNYDAGWDGLHHVTPITVPHFKWWMEQADTAKEIVDGYFAAHRRPRTKAADDRRVYCDFFHYSLKKALGQLTDDDVRAFREKYGEVGCVHCGSDNMPRSDDTCESCGKNYYSKRDADEVRGPEDEYCPHCDARLERGDDGKCNCCGKDWPEKQAEAVDVLTLLRTAKAESDRRNYAKKHAILRQLILNSPDDFVSDSVMGRFTGITHKPTKFRLHMPTVAVPTKTAANPNGTGSFYLDAIGQTPLSIKPRAGIFGNAVNHLRAIKARGDRAIAEAESVDRFQNAMDPNRSLRQLSSYLSGDREPIVSHPLDRLLAGG